MNRREFLTFSASAVLMAAFSPSFAAISADQQAQMTRITDYWNTIKTVQGQFSQVDSKGGQAFGDFYIKKPGRFRFDYKPPEELTVVADGYTVAVEDKKLETQDRYPLVQTPLSVLVDENITLQRNDIQIMDVASKAGIVTIHMKSLQKDAEGEILIAFAEADLTLQYWVVRDPSGSQVTVRVSNVVLQADIDSDKFFIKEQKDEEDDGR